MNQTSIGMTPIVIGSLILFIITSLIFDQYQRGYFFTSRSSDESTFIDQALSRLATCNEHDYPRQKSLLYTLQAWTRLAHSNHIRYWLGYRTLHGYLSHNDLPPYDHELHILIMADDTALLDDLSLSNHSSIYKLETHPLWFHTSNENRPRFPSKELDLKRQNARFFDGNTNLSINIWPIYTDDHSSKHSQMLVHNLDDDNSILTPIDWTFPLEPCVFSGIQVWCPARPKQLTVSMYGDTYPYLSCINGSWINSK